MVDTGARFLGEFQHTLDPKGRVILPSTFREALSEGLVMTVGLDNCLTLHPLDDWREVVERLRSLRSTDARERMYARMLRSQAHPDTLDRQGRVTIPARLRAYARLQKDVTVVGADQQLEIWDTARWEAYRNEGMDEFASTQQAFGMGSL